MFRWKLVATRVFILLLIVSAIWISRDALLRKLLIHSAESRIGAKVEIGQVFSSIQDRKIFIKQLTVADPRDPMKNLFQADTAIMELDWNALFRRKFVIKNGSTSQLVFGSPRTNPGLIGGKSQDFVSRSADQGEMKIELDGPDPRESWLDQFKFAKTKFEPEKLQLTAAARSIFEDLDSDLNQHLAQMQKLKSSILQITDFVKGYDDNVLRSQKLREAQNRIGLVNKDIDVLARKLSELDLQIAEYQQLLTAARDRDEALLLQKSPRNVIEGEILSGLLLNEEQLQQARDILEWYLAFKNAIPNPCQDFCPSASDGSNITLKNYSNTPAFLIESLDLDGEGRFGGQKFSFTGELKGFALDSGQLQQPMTCQLRAQGNTHFVVDFSIDHSNQLSAKDHIQMICPDIPLPARLLPADVNPSHEMLQLSVSPCRAKIDIELDSNGQELTGRFIFDYENLVTQIEQLDQRAGGKSEIDRINLELGSISSYRVTAYIGGTVAQPAIRFESNLGDRLASKFNDVLGGESTAAKDQLDELLANYQSKLSGKFAEEIRAASEKLQNEIITPCRTATAALNRLPTSSNSNQLRRR